MNNSTANLSENLTSFVYEDLVVHIQAIQYQIIEISKYLNIKWNNKMIRKKLKSRSITFIDPYGNLITNECMDHELISTSLKKYKKNYIAKYLHKWIKIGTMNNNFILPLNEYELKSPVSQYPDGYQFITYGDLNTWGSVNCPKGKRSKGGQQHTHLSSPEHVQVRKLRKRVKDRVTQENIAIGRIYDDELARSQLSQTALVVAPTAEEAKSAMNRIRRQLTPVLPECCNFEIPAPYSETISGCRFLLSDINMNKKRIVLFATDQQLQLLFKAKHVLMDGTFDSAPPYFSQVYTLHAIKHGKTFPCVIGLLTGKTSSIYERMFDELTFDANRLNMFFEPERITSDFEKSLIKAVSNKFSSTYHSGCYFHFSQCIYRKIQSLGLSTLYRDDEDVRSTCRQLMALPFLPMEEIEFAFEELMEQSPTV
ncbi:unnamed protein product, partial [Rotaria sp. Silwood2]